MNLYRILASLSACTILSALAGCGEVKIPGVVVHPPSGTWSLVAVGSVEGLDAPEGVRVDEATGVGYVSNMVTGEGNYWQDDGKGFVSTLRPGGRLAELRWLDSTPAEPIHEPKGMCILRGVLYVADNTRVVAYSIDDGKRGVIPIPGAQQINDVATDGRAVYATDTGGSAIYKLAAGAPPREIKSPRSPNGVTFDANGTMFVASWEMHEVFETDPRGAGWPVPFGLSDRFGGLDGIEVLPDGTFIVTDLKDGKIHAISADRKTVTTLANVTTPTDIGLDRKRLLLYVPMLHENRVAIFRLVKK